VKLVALNQVIVDHEEVEANQGAIKDKIEMNKYKEIVMVGLMLKNSKEMKRHQGIIVAQSSVNSRKLSSNKITSLILGVP
jgi:hypothetical protein